MRNQNARDFLFKRTRENSSCCFLLKLQRGIDEFGHEIIRAGNTIDFWLRYLSESCPRKLR
jgi:hypothetical protein